MFQETYIRKEKRTDIPICLKRRDDVGNSKGGVCSSDRKSSGGRSGVTFDATKNGFVSNSTDSEGSEFSASDTLLAESCAPIYDRSFSFSRSDATHIGNLNLRAHILLIFFVMCCLKYVILKILRGYSARMMSLVWLGLHVIGQVCLQMPQRDGLH